MKTPSPTETSVVPVRLAELGHRLLTRDQGFPVRQSLRARLEAGENLEILLEGVEVITPSFADEALGRLLLEIGRDAFRARIRLRAGDETTRRLVNRVLQHRAADAARRDEAGATGGRGR